MKPNRRRFLQATSVGALSSVMLNRPGAAASEARHNPIVAENQKEGALDWQLTRVRLDRGPTGYRAPAVEGYVSRQSVKAGESLDFMVSTKPASAFKIEIFRMGWYGGRGARKMAELGPFKGATQPEPPIGERRLRECRWEPSTTFAIPADWVSGVYLGRLTTVPDGAEQPYWQSYTVFIVRDDRPADILFQCSDNTWQAYNRWPDGWSLYTDPRAAHAPDVAVSFDRPYGKYCQIFDAPQSIGSGEFLLWEFPLAYWLEEHGYDVTYVSNADMIDPSQMRRCRAFVSVGHDEYWDERQYQSVKQGIEGGTAALWFSGNSCFAVSPFEPSSSGAPQRIIWRKGLYGGLTNEELQAEEKVFKGITYRGPDESLIIGARSIVPFNGGGDWICEMPEHWAFQGSGMKKGDAIPGLVGWEHHGSPAPISNLQVLARGTVWAGGTKPAHWTSTLFEGPHQNIVFNAATIFWSQGLSSPPGHMLPWSHWSRPHGVDERVRQMTHNVLRRALA